MPTAMPKLGGIGDPVAAAMKDISPKYNNGKTIEVVEQKLGFHGARRRPGCESNRVVPMAFGNLATRPDSQRHSRAAGGSQEWPLRQRTAGCRHFDERNWSIVEQFYDTDRYRPRYENFEMKPLFIATSEYRNFCGRTLCFPLPVQPGGELLSARYNFTHSYPQ